MSYIDSNLMPNEQVIIRGKIHLFLLLRPMLVAATTLTISLAGIGALAAAGGKGAVAFIGFLCAIVGALMFLGSAAASGAALLAYIGNEVAVTDRRVIGKFGIVRRSTLEFPFRQIESIAFDQGIVDRLVGAAQIKIRGAGSAWVETPILSNYKAFRHAALEQMEARHSSGGPVERARTPIATSSSAHESQTPSLTAPRPL